MPANFALKILASDNGYPLARLLKLLPYSVLNFVSYFTHKIPNKEHQWRHYKKRINRNCL